MTYIRTLRLYFGLLFLILHFQRCCSASALSVDVQCTIINSEYVECIWPLNTSTVNYTFSSAFANDTSPKDCPEYILEQSYTAGCRTPLGDPKRRFDKFNINVFAEENYTHSFDSLQRNVKLNAPYNLSVMWDEHSGSLLLQWNSSGPLSKSCVVYMVRNQKDMSQSLNMTQMSYSLSQVSRNKLYVFQVRSTIAYSCGPSDLWSDWSDPVTWGNAENVSSHGWLQGLFAILSIFLLLLLGLLLYCCERKKILLPVVPDPRKNLQDLFHKHDGNVESWIHISRELKEAFQPDYTEPSCDVCEVTPPPADPTPEASPASQTDNCDEPNTEEEIAEQQRS